MKLKSDCTIKIFVIYIFLNLSFLNSFSQMAIPTATVKGYALTVNNLYLEIDPNLGARVISLKLDNEEILFVNSNEGNNWGSTFWPSPQASWNWPPPKDLDSNAYVTTLNGNIISLRSKVDIKSGLQFVKNIFGNIQDSSLIFEYIIINTNDSAINVAPWEVTRYPSGGLTFFPQRILGESITGDLRNSVVDGGGISWFDYDSSNASVKNPKFFSDGTEGWLAHVRRNGVIVVKKFTDSDISQKAPKPENEIEYYSSPDKNYQEVEQQGPYTTVAAGDSLVWNVKWLVRKLPASVSPKSENPLLATYVRKLIDNSVLAVEDEKISTFNVFPNPAKNSLTVESNNGFSNLQIVNSQGKVVKEMAGTNNFSVVLDISNFTSGVYFIKNGNGKNAVTKSFIIE